MLSLKSLPHVIAVINAATIVVLCYGRIFAKGTPEAIRRNQDVIDAYLGTDHHAGAPA